MKGRTLKDLPPVDRPREKLQQLGPAALKDTELLAILLSSGTKGLNVLELAGRLLKRHGGKELPKLSVDDLREIKGVGVAKACQLVACFELARRLLAKEDEEEAIIRKPQDIYTLTKDLQAAKKEHFVVLYLDARNKVLKKETISIGTLTGSLVHPREIFQPAVSLSAAGVILVHNHPSGDTEPSQDDLALTSRLVKAGEIMGIEVLDHLIVGHKTFLSLRDAGLL